MQLLQLELKKLYLLLVLFLVIYHQGNFSNYKIEICNNKEIIYKIIVNGDPNKLIDIMSLNGFKIDTSKKVWRLN